jgi:hypothetical protein
MLTLEFKGGLMERKLKVFLSRGLSPEDRAIGDPIAKIIRELGFQTITVGIEVKAPEEEVPETVKKEIKNSDALIAIATPRFMDAFTELWKTLEWLHAEIGIAFGIDKPLLILKDRQVSLGGLPSYLGRQQKPVIEFDASNLDILHQQLSVAMPIFREWVKVKREHEFYDTLDVLRKAIPKSDLEDSKQKIKKTYANWIPPGILCSLIEEIGDPRDFHRASKLTGHFGAGVYERKAQPRFKLPHQKQRRHDLYAGISQNPSLT